MGPLRVKLEEKTMVLIWCSFWSVILFAIAVSAFVSTPALEVAAQRGALFTLGILCSILGIVMAVLTGYKYDPLGIVGLVSAFGLSVLCFAATAWPDLPQRYAAWLQRIKYVTPAP
ncbi:MAG: hypothetical protein HY455_02305 [Parcubacteria group bacterium]|nr:hypothetical protein [Parcubacteria group bacterium]